MLGNRSLTLPKGTAFTCALKTKVISATSGLVGCQVQRNVFSDDGRVLLIERGSHMDGEYRIASVRPGTVRIPVLWTRIRTPHGVTVDIDSPGTGQLGESGIDGYVDNRWVERIGAAMLLSLIDDSVQLVIQNQTSDTQGDTIVLPSTTSSTSKLAEKVLDSTINIPPLIYQNQGGIVGIYVARDVDFSSVYELKPTASGSTAMSHETTLMVDSLIDFFEKSPAGRATPLRSSSSCARCATSSTRPACWRSASIAPANCSSRPCAAGRRLRRPR